MSYLEMVVSKMALYESMKDSRVEWLGKIPSSWGTILVKHIFSIKKNIANESGHTVLSVTQRGIIPKNMTDKGQFAKDYSHYQLVSSGEFVMNHMDLLTGWIDISKYDGVTSPDYRVFINEYPEKFISEYYKYVFQYCYFNRIFYGLGQGVAGFGRWRLPADMFLNFVLPVPSVSEQSAIAAYLDDQCAKIDTLIEEAKASIEEYKQWKASLIFEAVTKGLDPNVEMKDSGVDIIGKMPSSWGLIKTRFLCSIMTGNQDTQNAVDDGMYPFYVRSPKVEKANVYTYDGEGVLMAGDGAGAGRVFHHAFGKYAIHQRVYCFHDFTKVLPAFFCYFMENRFSNEMDKGSAKSTVPSVRLPMILNFKICIPLISEQQNIVDYIDVECGSIDSIINEKLALISDLESYKKSLIFETVTGKRKVV